MPLFDFMKRPVRVLVFIGAFATILALFPLLGVRITHLEIAIIGLGFGVFALLSGVMGAVSAFNEWRKASGGLEDLAQAGIALVVIAIGCILAVLGTQAAFALSHDTSPHHVKSSEPAT